MLIPKQQRTKRGGAAIVEAAVILPVMIVLIGISVDFSRIFYDNVILSQSARNGALYEFDPMNASQSRYLDYTVAGRADATNMKRVNFSKSEASPATNVTNVTVNANSNFRTIASWFILPQSRSVDRTIVIRKAQLIPDQP